MSGGTSSEVGLLPNLLDERGCLFDCVFLFENFVGFWVETFSRFPVELSPERFRIATSEIGGSELVSEGQSPLSVKMFRLQPCFSLFPKVGCSIVTDGNSGG